MLQIASRICDCGKGPIHLSIIPSISFSVSLWTVTVKGLSVVITTIHIHEKSHEEKITKSIKKLQRHVVSPWLIIVLGGNEVQEKFWISQQTQFSMSLCFLISWSVTWLALSSQLSSLHHYPLSLPSFPPLSSTHHLSRHALPDVRRAGLVICWPQPPASRRRGVSQMFGCIFIPAS